MPARSKKQRKLFGVARAVQKGELAPSKATKAARKIAMNVKPKVVKEFAKTKERGLRRTVKSKRK